MTVWVKETSAVGIIISHTYISCTVVEIKNKICLEEKKNAYIKLLNVSLSSEPLRYKYGRDCPCLDPE